MPQTDLEILGQIRERRFDHAVREKNRKEREHEAAVRAAAAAKKTAEDARVSAEQEVAEIYAELFSEESCSVADVEGARIQEALLRERVAKLEKDAAQAELAVQKAAELAEDARIKMAEANAAKEAIELIRKEEAKKMRIEQGKKEDDLIDELATIQSAARRSQ